VLTLIIPSRLLPGCEAKRWGKDQEGGESEGRVEMIRRRGEDG